MGTIEKIKLVGTRAGTFHSVAQLRTTATPPGVLGNNSFSRLRLSQGTVKHHQCNGTFSDEYFHLPVLTELKSNNA